MKYEIKTTSTRFKPILDAVKSKEKGLSELYDLQEIEAIYELLGMDTIDIKDIHFSMILEVKEDKINYPYYFLLNKELKSIEIRAKYQDSEIITQITPVKTGSKK